MMMSKIVNRLNSMNDFSKKIIVYSSVVSLTLCLLGMGVIIYNAHTNLSNSLHAIGSSMIHAAIVMFAQFTIGSLVIDFLSAVINSHDDD